MRTVGLSLVAAACVVAASAAKADEVRLADQQLDAVTAGLDLGFDPADFSLASSPLLRQAALIVAFELDQTFVEQSGGESLFVIDNDTLFLARSSGSSTITEQSTLGPITTGLLDFALPLPRQEFPFGLRPME